MWRKLDSLLLWFVNCLLCCLRDHTVETWFPFMGCIKKSPIGRFFGHLSNLNSHCVVSVFLRLSQEWVFSVHLNGSPHLVVKPPTWLSSMSPLDRGWIVRATQSSFFLSTGLWNKELPFVDFCCVVSATLLWPQWAEAVSTASPSS